MKIHADKIEAGPPYALSARHIRIILDTVPLEWKEEIKEVHISNSLEWRAGHAWAFFSRYDGCLTIYSRKVTTDVALEAVLSEIAAISLRLDNGLRRRPKAIRDRLSKMIAQLMRKLLPRIQSKSGTKRHVGLEGFREVHFAAFPNDPERK